MKKPLNAAGGERFQAGEEPGNERRVPCLEALRHLRDDLPEAERRVGDLVLADPERVLVSTVAEVADGSGVSVATVARLCAKVGYSGFKGMKVALAVELLELTGPDFRTYDSPVQVEYVRNFHKGRPSAKGRVPSPAGKCLVTEAADGWAAGRPPDAITRVAASFGALSAGHSRVAQLLLDDPRRAIRLSVTEFAAEAETSAATVVRTAQQLGYRGFQDLKLAVAQSLAGGQKPVQTSDVAASDPAGILAHALCGGQRALADAAAVIDARAFARAVDALSGASRVVVVGSGTGHVLAHEAAVSLVSVGWPAEAPAEVMAMHLAARRMHPTDICLAISVSGSTVPTLEAVELARSRGATVVAITGPMRSPLGDAADLALVTGARETGRWHSYLEGSGRRVAVMRVLHALCAALAHGDPERSEEAFEAKRDVSVRHHE